MPASSLLTTKFYIPSPRSDLAMRPRLIEKINEGIDRKLCLISAPAGFGKTTLLSEWVERHKKSVAWLSLDEEENDLVRFLTYFVTALQMIDKNIGEDVLISLQSLQPPSSKAVMVALINQIAILPNQFILILDDYHSINTVEIDEALTYLIEHQPPNMHLIISARVDPFLPLARFRSQGQMNEIREDDLRFSIKEATIYLNKNMKLDLSEKDIYSLNDRTEGWITGLHLAGLSLQEQEDRSTFISKFTGHHRNVADYLIDEVLAQCPKGTKDFLLQTSILDRMTGDLCNVVTGQQNSQAILEQLEKSNIFLVPLDDNRQSYRYHHLFAELLRYRLRLNYKDSISELHVKASEWYEQDGYINNAIKHAIAGEDYKRAIGLIQSISQGFRNRGEVSNLLIWKDDLPLSEISKNPEVCISFAWALLLSGKSEEIDQYLFLAEKYLDQLEHYPDNLSPSNIVHNRQARGQIALIRGEIAYNQNDLSLAEEIAQQALTLLPSEDADLRNCISVLLGWVYLQKNDHLAARKIFEGILSDIKTGASIPYFLMDMLVGLGRVLIELGLLSEAEDICKFILDAAKKSGMIMSPIGALSLLSYANLHIERNEMEKAEKFLEQAEEIFTQAKNSSGLWKVYRIQYRVLRAKGLFEEALESLDQQEIISIRTNSKWDFGLINAFRTDIWLAQGNIVKAVKWTKKFDSTINDYPPYVQEIRYFVLAKVYIAQGDFDKVDKLLRNIMKNLEAGERTGKIISVLILQSLSFQAQSNIAEAVVVLDHALSLAAPENFSRPFINEGEPMQKLLKEAASQGISSGFVDVLLSAMTPKDQLEKDAAAPKMIKLLSERELEVLILMAQGLKYNQIAEQLIVSLNTIRSHTKNIYSKLEVNNRTQAIQKANDLNLL